MRAARREVVRADAVVSVRNEQLDEQTTKFAGQALVESGSDRKSPRFLRFFSRPPSEFIRTALRKQCERTLNHICAELDKVEKTSILKPFTNLLRTGATTALAALDARARAEGVRGSTGSDINDWKRGVNRTRTSVYGDLLKLAAEKGYPKRFAEAFFRQESSVAEESDEPAAAPANPSGTAV